MMEHLMDALFDLILQVRYVAVYRLGELSLRQRSDLNLAPTPESDRYEELLVNPTLLTLTRQRGDIDCGGLDSPGRALRRGSSPRGVHRERDARGAIRQPPASERDGIRLLRADPERRAGDRGRRRPPPVPCQGRLAARAQRRDLRRLQLHRERRGLRRVRAGRGIPRPLLPRAADPRRVSRRSGARQYRKTRRQLPSHPLEPHGIRESVHAPAFCDRDRQRGRQHNHKRRAVAEEPRGRRGTMGGAALGGGRAAGVSRGGERRAHRVPTGRRGRRREPLRRGASPVVAYEKLPFYESPGLHRGLLAGSLAVFLLTALAWPVGAGISRWYRKRHEQRGEKPQRGGGAPRQARLLAWAVCVLDLLFVVGMAVVISSDEVMAYGVSSLLIAVLALPLLGAVLTVGVLVYAALSWKRGYWGLFGRLHYSLIALSALTFIVLLGYYNLLGFQF